MPRRLRLLLLSALWVAPFVAAAAFWWWFHVHSPVGNLLDMSDASRLIALGSLAGLLAATGAIVQLMLVGRVGWLERLGGLDRLWGVHRINGMMTAGLVGVHVLLVTIGHGNKQLIPVGFFEQMGDFLTKWDDLPLALAGAGMIVAMGVVSAGPVRRRINFEWWYRLHLLLYGAVAVAIFHQFRFGTGLTSDTPSRAFFAYWVGLYAFCGANLLAYRVARPLWRFARHRFVVDRLHPETDQATSVHITGRALESLPARAGQFVLVRFLSRGHCWQEHPFSLSQPPDGKALRLTVKDLGDFTATVPVIRPGTSVLVDGPHGKFVSAAAKRDKILLLAGGIGITPIRGLAEEFAEQGRDVVLLYASRTERQIVFKDELDDLAARRENFRVVHVISKPVDWTGPRGRIDRKMLADLVPDAADREAYVCGPASMSDAIARHLRAIGVPRGRIHRESFSL